MVTSSETRSSTDGVVSSAESAIVACGSSRVLPRITRSASFLVVVASHDASRSGSRMRPQCSASRSHTVCTTSSVEADDSRNDRATDHTRPAKRSTSSFQARSSPATTRLSSSWASTGAERTRTACVQHDAHDEREPCEGGPDTGN